MRASTSSNLPLSCSGPGIWTAEPVSRRACLALDSRCAIAGSPARNLWQPPERLTRPVSGWLVRDLVQVRAVDVDRPDVREAHVAGPSEEQELAAVGGPCRVQREQAVGARCELADPRAVRVHQVELEQAT